MGTQLMQVCLRPRYSGKVKHFVRGHEICLSSHLKALPRRWRMLTTCDAQNHVQAYPLKISSPLPPTTQSHPTQTKQNQLKSTPPKTIVQPNQLRTQIDSFKQLKYDLKTIHKEPNRTPPCARGNSTVIVITAPQDLGLWSLQQVSFLVRK